MIKNTNMDNIKNLNTLKEVEEYRKKINEACDERASYINRCIEANDLSKKSFVYLKEAFEAIAPELYKTSQGKKVIKKYTNTIRENKNLSGIHSLCENVRKANKDSDVNFLINEISSKSWIENRKTLKEDVATIGRIVAEGYLLAGSKENLPKENQAFVSSLTFIAENKKTNKNIAEFSDAIKIIREHIENAEPKKNVFENVNLDKVVEELLEEFNKKYSDSLNEEELKALKEISESEDREAVFENYKKQCINKINEAKAEFSANGDTASSERLSSVLEQVSNKKYTLDTIGSDICNLIELTNIF
jgi:hypothetical protein